MPSWASSPPPMSSPGPGGSVSDDHQPLYDTIGPRVTADGSSSSALSLNKIAGLTPGNVSGLGSPRSSTLARGHKISLPAYYVPIEEVEIPPASPLVQQRHQHQSSTPNMLSGYSYNNNSHNGSGTRENFEADQHQGELADAPLLSPIPDLRAPGNRASVSSLSSNTGLRRKTPPAVAPKPGLVKSRPASAVHQSETSSPSSPAKIAPKPPPKPKKRPSTANSDGLAAFEDEVEDVNKL